jgi:hypothetical protein
MGRNEITALEVLLAEFRDFRIEYREDKTTTNERLQELEDDVKGAKLIGRVSFGLALAIGGFVSWAVNLLDSLKSLSNNT